MATRTTEKGRVTKREHIVLAFLVIVDLAVLQRTCEMERGAGIIELQ